MGSNGRGVESRGSRTSFSFSSRLFKASASPSGCGIVSRKASMSVHVTLQYILSVVRHGSASYLPRTRTQGDVVWQKL